MRKAITITAAVLVLAGCAREPEKWAFDGHLTVSWDNGPSRNIRYNHGDTHDDCMNYGRYLLDRLVDRPSTRYAHYQGSLSCSEAAK